MAQIEMLGACKVFYLPGLDVTKEENFTGVECSGLTIPLDLYKYVDVYLIDDCRFRKKNGITMYNFDKIDIKIVNLLLEDGRMPASEIARRMGDISERAVRYRIDRMVNEGVVRISAVARPQAFGLTTIADIWMEVESDRILEVARKLAEFDNVSYVACGIGESDVSIQIVAKDTAEIYQFVTEVVRKVPGVRKTTTSIVPLIIKDVYQWRVPERIARELSEKEVQATTE
jgi:Lrp/AsnC family transcriptional regulator, regulator for asnA, asnC and gidA